MKALQEAIRRLLRGPRAARFLRTLGIDSKRYWLLMDLFGLLSERGEMLDQLGRSGVGLQVVAWLYAGLSALLSILLVVVRSPLVTYFSVFLVMTAFLLLTVLLSEAGNSLVNPVEGLVLAHQPVNGATYTAAKLTHLARIVLWMVPALNLIPALLGLALNEARWFYPFLHLLAALAVGLVAALLCCAFYGWLMRFIPARRLKAAGQIAAVIPFLGMVAWPQIRVLLVGSRLLHWLPAQPAARWVLGLALVAAVAATVILGIRSLSADYLIRVSGIMHGGSAAKARARRSWMGGIVARLFGRQPGRAAFAFVSCMMRRDYQFRRQAVPTLIYGLVGLAPLVARGWRTDPLSGRFSIVHLLPHIIGGVLFFVCSLLPYGNDFKGAWVFLLAPARVFGPFARGVYAALWIPMVVIPHGIMLLLFAWPWGMWHAGLFVAYSAAVSSVYLALELRLIDSAPFSRQVDATRGAMMPPLMILAGVVVAAAVGLQYYFVFRSSAAVAIVTVLLGAAAYFLTRRSLGALEVSIRYNLGLLSAESGTLYKEIDM